MEIDIEIMELIALGLSENAATRLSMDLKSHFREAADAKRAWFQLDKTELTQFSFPVQHYIYEKCYPTWREHPELAPAWQPQHPEKTNLAAFLQRHQLPDLQSAREFAAEDYTAFWKSVIATLNIAFEKEPHSICDLSAGIENPAWLPGARMNIVNSCFQADPAKIAMVYLDHTRQQKTLTYAALNTLSNQIAASLVENGFKAGDAIGIAMPMTHYAIAIYLGILKMGGVVVCIADSFSGKEMATRLQITKAKGFFTQDVSLWGEKIVALYDKISGIPNRSWQTIVVPAKETVDATLNGNDLTWQQFLKPTTDFTAVTVDPLTPCTILFSSGTTSEPKAIIWNHTTPIKAASDAYFHQDIKPQDVLAWPTNLGWMMGPWLIFAALINHATLSIYPFAPKDRAFGEFIAKTGVTMLGLVPTIVSAWRKSGCMEKLDWQKIKCFSSTGECSNPEDMLYLMSLAGYKPIIEYCGGTEIGGAYITSTLIEENAPSVFTGPALGSAFVLLDENGEPSNQGEVALIPPALGLSTQLLNADHFHVYYENMPRLSNGNLLRRHGDQLRRSCNGHYMVLGRMDDTMKISGIKVSAAEIERALVGVTGIQELAAVAIAPPQAGPNRLVIYAATQIPLDATSVLRELQQHLSANLNPLIRISEVVFVKELPKTASNKIMRRLLRTQA